jgi:hypothetical protein
MAIRTEKAPTANQPPFQIHEWKPLHHGTLRGYISVLFPSGLILRSLQVHETDGRRWIGYPMRGVAPEVAASGIAPVLSFESQKKQQKFENTLFYSLRPFLKRDSAR